ncbi:nephrin [Trichonephila clavipes]|nr:nephrin [Trichonephila clavipes]
MDSFTINVFLYFSENIAAKRHKQYTKLKETSHFHKHSVTAHLPSSCDIFYVFLLDGATVESVIIASPSGPVFEGSEATLECRATAHPAKTEMIKWRIKGLARNSRPTLDSTKSILHISNVSRDLRGPVECWADNGIGGPSVLSVLLNVLYKPMILSNGGELDADLARLKCVVDGTPNVTITWTFNGTVLRVNSDKYSVTLTQKGDVQWTSILTVKDIDPADHGIYTCVSKNTLGYDSADIILNDKAAITQHLSTLIHMYAQQTRFEAQANFAKCRLKQHICRSLVYADKPQTLDHLEDNIRRIIADIRPQMLEKVIENWTSRFDYFRASCDSPMPEIIFKM